MATLYDEIMRSIKALLFKRIHLKINHVKAHIRSTAKAAMGNMAADIIADSARVGKAVRPEVIPLSSE